MATGRGEEPARALEAPAVATYSVPRRILFGIGSLEGLPAEVKRLGRTRLLLVTDQGIVKAGLLERLLAVLEPGGFHVDVFDTVEPDPSLTLVDACVSRLRAGGRNLVIGLGGGSPMDVAKYSAALAAHPGSAREYLGHDLLTGKGLPAILIPTTAGSGSEVTRAAVFHDAMEGTKRAVWSDCVLADVAILDPSLTVSQPSQVTADAGLDALAHAVEASVAVDASPLTDLLALEAIRLTGKYLPIAFREPGDLAARGAMAFAAMLAGMACSNAGLGAAHALGLLLDVEFGLTHGRSVAVLLPHVVAFNLPDRPAPYARIAEVLGESAQGGVQAMAESLTVRLTRFLEELEIPTFLRHYGMEAARLQELGERGHRVGERLLPMNPRPVGVADAVWIYRQAF